MKSVLYKRILPAVFSLMVGCSISMANTNALSSTPDVLSLKPSHLLQDTTSKKATAGKKIEKDRTRGEGGVGTDSTSTGNAGRTGRQSNDTMMNRNSGTRNDQSSDNRGEGMNKDNRAGNRKTDTTRRHQ